MSGSTLSRMCQAAQVAISRDECLDRLSRAGEEPHLCRSGCPFRKTTPIVLPQDPPTPPTLPEAAAGHGPGEDPPQEEGTASVPPPPAHDGSRLPEGTKPKNTPKPLRGHRRFLRLTIPKGTLLERLASIKKGDH